MFWICHMNAKSVIFLEILIREKNSFIRESRKQNRRNWMTEAREEMTGEGSRFHQRPVLLQSPTMVRLAQKLLLFSFLFFFFKNRPNFKFTTLPKSIVRLESHQTAQAPRSLYIREGRRAWVIRGRRGRTRTVRGWLNGGQTGQGRVQAGGAGWTLWGYIFLQVVDDDHRSTSQKSGLSIHSSWDPGERSSI